MTATALTLRQTAAREEHRQADSRTTFGFWIYIMTDCVLFASLFAAFAEFVTTYGEEAAARFAEGLAVRIRNGEFSVAMARQ